MADIFISYARAVADQLAVSLGLGAAHTADRTDDIEAYEKYLRANQSLDLEWTLAFDAFDRALILSPNDTEALVAKQAGIIASPQ